MNALITDKCRLGVLRNAFLFVYRLSILGHLGLARQGGDLRSLASGLAAPCHPTVKPTQPTPRRKTGIAAGID